MNLKDFLKSELNEARDDFKKRTSTQEYLIKRHNELSSATIKASTNEELSEVIKIVNSWLMNLDSMECEELFYIGDVPDTYLTNTWKDFVNEWKPKFLTILESANYKQNHLINPIATYSEKLKNSLIEHGFFELSKVKQLSEHSKQTLLELICTNETPYGIAMFEFLGYIKLLKTEYFNNTDYKLQKALAEWFSVSERTIKGNINVLSEFSNDNRKRYTSHNQKKNVQKDYEKLK